MTLPLLTIYPANRNIRILRNSTFRKRWLLKFNGDPVDMATVDLDSDIHDSTGNEIGTFTFVLPQDGGQAVPGVFDMQLSPQQSLALPAGSWQYDISATFNSGPYEGDRFYYITGTAAVENTNSRNT